MTNNVFRPVYAFALASALVGCTKSTPTVTVTKRVVAKPVAPATAFNSEDSTSVLVEPSSEPTPGPSASTRITDTGTASRGTTSSESNPAESTPTPAELAQLLPMEPTPAGDGVAASVTKTSEPTVETPAAGPHPIAVIENYVHEFGNMEPHQNREHTFVIRNDGKAPLKIRAGESSCKCTIGKVGSEIIRPGGTSTILLSWYTTTETKLFAHEAEVLTNDPNHPVLVCRVQGTVIQQVQTSPSAFTFSGLTPGKPATMSIAVTSQVWDQFDLTNIQSTMDGLVHEVTPMTDEERAEQDVKAGYHVAVTLPANLKKGPFAESLRIHLRPQNHPAEIYEIPVTGRVLRRVSVYGKGVNSYGIMNLGRVPIGKGIQKSFIVKVRDPDPVLAVKELKTVPDFLQVRFADAELGVPGLYRMTVEVPKTAPASFYSAAQGRLHIAFQNPRFEDLDLSVEFAVGNDS